MIENRAPQLIIMISGCVALITGIVMLSVQFLHELHSGNGAPPTIGGVGFTVFAIGASLEAIGYMATLPWRTGDTRQLS